MSVAIRAAESSTGLLVHVSGVIDQSLDLSSLFGRWHSCIVFDLSEVTGVTSFGVREWMRALESLRADYCCFIRCSPSVVSQFNLVTNFGGRGELVSFLAPFRCPECDTEIVELIDLRRDAAVVQTLDLPVVTCNRCGATAEFDDIEDLYFDYAAAAPPPRPTANAQLLIDGRADDRPKFHAEKLVRGTVTLLRLRGPIDRRAYFKRLVDGLQGEVIVALAEVTEVTDDGVRGLTDLLCAPALSVTIAHVPPVLFRPLAGVFSEVTDCRARAISLSVPFLCVACDRELHYVVQGEQLSALLAGIPPSCSSCGTPLVSHHVEAERAALARLPTTTPSQDVADLAEIVGELDSVASRRHLLLGRYKIEKQIGRGGMGEVFLARQIGPASFEKFVVLKRIRRDIVSAEIAEGFLREALIAARLSHRNIVQIFDFGRVDDDYIIAMEYVVGLDLFEALRVSRAARVTWPVALCCHIVSELCAALQAAHTHRDDDGNPAPIIHRDVSPSNILLAAEGAVKLTDFGVATALGRSPTTSSGIFKGKRAYAPPEQRFGGTIPSPSTDVFAAGIILYECLTLRRFPARDGSSLRAAGSPPSLSIRNDIPPALRDAFERAVSLQPQDRFESAQDLRSALGGVLEEMRPVTSEDLSSWVKQLMGLAIAHPAPQGVEAGSLTLDPCESLSSEDPADPRVPDDD